MKLIWIDDECGGWDILIKCFVDDGHEVDRATSAQEGIASILANNYDGVILDMIMGSNQESHAAVADDAAVKHQITFPGLYVLRAISEMPKEEWPAVVVITIAVSEALTEKLKEFKKQGIVKEIMFKGALRNEQIMNTVETAVAGNVSEGR